MRTTRPTIVSVSRYRWGLGNRVRTLLGAAKLAQATDRSLAYVWPTGREFGPRMTDLWDFPHRRIPQVASRALALRYPYLDEKLGWLDDQAGRTVWQIRTPHALELPTSMGSWTEMLRELRPAAAISDRVRQFAAGNLGDEAYVGVMIRAHDRSHSKTLATSPVEWFLTRMDELGATHPGIRFFVSCDVAEVAQEVCQRVPGAVTQADKGEYNTVIGVQAAVADLYLLAGSGYILGPHWSSFVDLASYLAGEILPLVTPGTQGPPGELYPTPAADPLRPWAR